MLFLSQKTEALCFIIINKTDLTTTIVGDDDTTIKHVKTKSQGSSKKFRFIQISVSITVTILIPLSLYIY